MTRRTMHPRPAHLDPVLLLAVFAGGVLGTAARATLALAVPPAAGVPVATIAVNLVGAFALGALLTALGRRGPDTGRRRLARLLIGTGVLGGFTTYSSLAVDTTQLLTHADTLPALCYGVGSVLGGLLAGWLGMLAGGARP